MNSHPSPGSGGRELRPDETLEIRSLFWQNIVQQMLTIYPKQAQENPDLTDGRLAVLTRGGERIGIHEIRPLFSCSVDVLPGDRALSQLVQCTVFEIHTPDGEVVTLPLEEIRGIHSLSEELVRQLKDVNAQSDAESEPFGFAAFTSLARERRARAQAGDESHGNSATP